MEWFENIIWFDKLLNFIIGLVTSTVFVLVILRMLKPKIEISDMICVEEDKESGKKLFIFKIVNMSKFDSYSIEFELHRREPYIVDKNKVNHKVNRIELTTSKLYTIPSFKKDKGYGDHAILIATPYDISNDINENNLEYMLFVSAKHGLSNLTKVKTQTFENSEVFHNGSFKFGKNLGVC